MPNSSEHKTKAERNANFLGTFDTSISPEWKVVVAFYTALHAVERLASCENKHHSDHHSRLAFLRSHRSHRPIYEPFSVLHDASSIARYHTHKKFVTAFPKDAVETKLISECLQKIETHVSEHFAKLSTLN